MHGDGVGDSCGTRGNPAGMETNVRGLPRGWNKIVRDSRGNVPLGLFHFYGVHAATKICFQAVE